MSCRQATAPVNINANAADKCSMKCSYVFGYPLTDLTVENRGEYLRFGPSPQRNAPANYNNEKYMVKEIRLYQPSLHTWGGEHTEAELVVVHNNLVTGQGLLVCVPVTSRAPISSGGDILATLLARAAESAPSKGGNAGSVKLPTFTCGKFIPYSQPFYSYVGTLPYSPCNGTYNYVVFDEGSALGITADTASKISQLIAKNTYATHNNPGGLFKNESGAVNSEVSGDGIYIECQPTGEEGEVIVPTAMNWLNDLTRNHASIVKVGKAIFVAIVVFVIASGLWWLMSKWGVAMTVASGFHFTPRNVDPNAHFNLPPALRDAKKKEEAARANKAKALKAKQAKADAAPHAIAPAVGAYMPGMPMGGMMGQPYMPGQPNMPGMAVPAPGRPRRS